VDGIESEASFAQLHIQHASSPVWNLGLGKVKYGASGLTWKAVYYKL